MYAYMMEQLKAQVEENKTLREEAFGAKLQLVQAELDMERKQRVKCEEKLTPQPIVSDEQLVALQARLEAVHAAKLLSEDEVGLLEDCVADMIELKATSSVLTREVVDVASGGGRLLRLVALSEGLANDRAFARQARRKFAT